jgi:hypothetical protein
MRYTTDGPDYSDPFNPTDPNNPNAVPRSAIGTQPTGAPQKLTPPTVTTGPSGYPSVTWAPGQGPVIPAGGGKVADIPGLPTGANPTGAAPTSTKSTAPGYVNLNDPAQAAVWNAFQAKGINPRDQSDFQYWVDHINSTGGMQGDNANYWTTRMAAGQGGVGDYLERPEAGGAPAAAAGGTDPALQGILDLLTKQQASTEAQKAADQAKADQLYSTLQTQAGQSLALNPNDPIIKGQTDAYDAAQQRSRRNYLSSLAESSGPLANMSGATRTTAETLGQNDAAFTAQLMGNELQARRQQISDALNGMRSLLTPQQANDLQAELHQMDTAIGQQEASASLKQQGSEFNSSQAQALSLALQQLGLQNTNQTNYWNALYSGIL